MVSEFAGIAYYYWQKSRLRRVGARHVVRYPENMQRLALYVIAAMAVIASSARANPFRVVAAENFYAGVVRQVGGAAVQVTSILNNPDQDPHLFAPSAATARAIADAVLVVYNGAGYDPWVERLLAASPNPARHVIVAADVMHKSAGDNPHLWYDPRTMPAMAQRITAILTQLDPEHAASYAKELRRFEISLRPLADKIAELHQEYAGTPVTATEPVFGYMAAALGLKMRNLGFQRAVMNGTEPGASQIAAFQRDLQRRTVKVLLYNRQTNTPLSERMRAVAVAAGVPVVGVTETEPRGLGYEEWMLSQLAALERALAAR